MQVLPCSHSKNSSLVISGLGLSLFITPPSHFDHEPWATLDFRTSLNEFRQSCAIEHDTATLHFRIGGASDSAVANPTHNTQFSKAFISSRSLQISGLSRDRWTIGTFPEIVAAKTLPEYFG